MTTHTGVNIVSVTLVRWKKLKGGRKVPRAIREVSTNAPIVPDVNGKWTVSTVGPYAGYVLKGTMDEDQFVFVKGITAYMSKPYLCKSHWSITGIRLNTRTPDHA